MEKFVIVSIDNNGKRDFSHDWGGEFYHKEIDAEGRCEELKEYVEDISFRVIKLEMRFI